MAHAQKTHHKATRGAATPDAPTTPVALGEIDRLQAEHGCFERLMRMFGEQLAMFHEGRQPDYEVMRDVMQYMTHYPDLIHHPKEDLILRRLTERAKDSARFIAELHAEHERMAADGEALLRWLEEIVNDLSITPRAVVEDCARAYVSRLADHIRKEETLLFPLALRQLTPADWEAIAAERKRFEDPLFGPHVEPGYQALFRRLSGPAEPPAHP